MDWTEALASLHDGHAVARESWPVELYTDGRFQGGQMSIVLCNDNGEKPYEPTAEDKAATDWFRA